MNRRAEIGVIGGTGIQELSGLDEVVEVEVDTPFGAPSAPFVLGRLHGRTLAFLARHGDGHRLMPSEINFRANLYALKSLGVRRVFSASAVGSLREDVRPLDVVVPDQLFDRTRHRPDTFFGEGIVAHVGLAEPFCPYLRTRLLEAARREKVAHHDGGTYVCMEGPQFSTRAESMTYRAWGAAVIGMTNLQEAKLAREAEICYATLALVTDYDCWKVDEEPVTVDEVVENLRRNAASARRVIGAAVAALEDTSCACATALDAAVLTPRESIPAAVRRRLAPLLERYLAGSIG